MKSELMEGVKDVKREGGSGMLESGREPAGAEKLKLQISRSMTALTKFEADAMVSCSVEDDEL